MIVWGKNIVGTWQFKTRRCPRSFVIHWFSHVTLARFPNWQVNLSFQDISHFNLWIWLWQRYRGKFLVALFRRVARAVLRKREFDAMTRCPLSVWKMDIKRSQCSKCDGDVIVDTGRYPKCSSKGPKILKMLNTPGSKTKQEPTEVPLKSVETNYVTQIVSSGIRPDNVYEV